MMLKKSTNGCCNYDDNFCTAKLQVVDEVYVALVPPLAVQSPILYAMHVVML
jgi:hypothetical protein